MNDFKERVITKSLTRFQLYYHEQMYGKSGVKTHCVRANQTHDVSAPNPPPASTCANV